MSKSLNLRQVRVAQAVKNDKAYGLSPVEGAKGISLQEFLKLGIEGLPLCQVVNLMTSERGSFSLYSSLDLSTSCAVSSKRCFDYSQRRRQAKSMSRLNYLQYIGFDFGRCSAITLTINEDYIDDKKSIRLALNRTEDMLRRQGIDKYIIAKEEGELHRREHFHAILFDASFIPVSYKIYQEYAIKQGLRLSERELKNNFDDIWRIGQDIRIMEIKNPRGGVFYITAYIKKGLRLQWSKGFFKESLLRNDVYYMTHYDKKTGLIVPDKVFGVYITKSDYNIFKNHIPSALLARLNLKNNKKEV